jgi:hypothetical protein
MKPTYQREENNRKGKHETLGLKDRTVEKKMAREIDVRLQRGWTGIGVIHQGFEGGRRGKHIERSRRDGKGGVEKNRAAGGSRQTKGIMS